MKLFSRLALLAMLTLSIAVPSAGASYFPDVPDVHPYKDGINFLYEVGLVDGNPDGTFAPARTLNRAELAKLIVVAMGEDITHAPTDCFDDVAPNAWYAPYVCTAKDLGLVKGDGGAGLVYGPTRALNTAEILAVMDRLFGWETAAGTGETEWYVPYLQKARSLRVIEGKETGPDLVARQLFAQIMARSLVVYDAEAPAFSSATMYDDFFTAVDITADDCQVGEYYDEEAGTCVLDCSIDGQCDENQQATDELLAQVESGTSFAEHAKADGILAEYTVEDDRLSPTAAAAHEAMWQLFANLIPLDQRKDIVAYHVFTDGPDNLLASVSLSDLMPTKWVLSVDETDGVDASGNVQTAALTETLLHEFAHVFTLRIGQLRYDAPTCATYDTGEGCALPEAYIWKFYQKFWTTIAKDHPTKGASNVAAPSEEEVTPFYDMYADQFVTPYAATTPAEDIAETFTFFVLRPEPMGTSVVDQKINFFWQYPELVQLRTFIRNRIR
ncbi:hypothetical protein COW46_03845 [Candidatus Gracilibacteria bacterium CG17_big_fil_post_rev_8_21_14_2_50_48_13]|nr:MAG: hypothetical protein COW46_03845 [Candidatus Gracilibacteria bacterium CG17_big_fil_post_rev_8_21_14_2_50_48_13]